MAIHSCKIATMSDVEENKFLRDAHPFFKEADFYINESGLKKHKIYHKEIINNPIELVEWSILMEK